ncbi:MAG: hypothetical protein WBC04_18245 [Candidatus Acidiferrales bacterium]
MQPHPPLELNEEPFAPFAFVLALKTESCSVCRGLAHCGQVIFVLEDITSRS